MYVPVEEDILLLVAGRPKTFACRIIVTPVLADPAVCSLNKRNCCQR